LLIGRAAWDLGNDGVWGLVVILTKPSYVFDENTEAECGLPEARTHVAFPST
jgi:hypothetical protein